MDPAQIGIRIGTARGLRGEEVRTGFADAPEPDEKTLEISGIRLFVPGTLAERNATIDVADEHDRIVVR